MFLEAAFLRSYRSFHFDYKNKLNLQEGAFPACKRPWETESDFASWRPCIEVPLQQPITCVVGLNESGKSHLIDVVWKAIHRGEFKSEDVCRYSHECTLGNMGRPIVGLRWAMLSEQVVTYLNELVQASTSDEDNGDEEAETSGAAAEDSSGAADVAETRIEFEAMTMLHTGTDSFQLFITADDPDSPVRLTADTTKYDPIRDLLPRPIRVKSNVFLPSSVSLASLFKIALGNEAEAQQHLSELQELKVFVDIKKYNEHKVSDGDKLVYSLLQNCSNLNYSALCDIARGSEQLLKEFSSQGTERAEELLNLSHWWAQDVDTQLDIELRNNEVVLNVTDRTGSWYGLAERSQGMRYFLGYLIQVILELKRDDRPLLILSDEPDFALSAVGQRDLLRFFRKVVSYQRSDGTSQIVFTTHSAELVDPNYPDRITILRKGLFDEGTTVVSRTYHRLFEPVRTALGGRGSSLPFIDGPNLVVEGDSDRVFVTRMSQYLAKRNKRHLDLAYLSMVVAGGCKQMPGIVVSAKSMPGDRAYLTVLLDNDESGRKTATELGELDAYLKEQGQIVTIDELLEPGLGKDTETEDLVAPRLYFKAACKAFKEIQPSLDLSASTTAEQFKQSVEQTPTVDVLTELLKAQGDDLEHLYDKSAVFDTVFDLLDADDCDESDSQAFVEQLEKTAALLLEKVNDNLRHN